MYGLITRFFARAKSRKHLTDERSRRRTMRFEALETRDPLTVSLVNGDIQILQTEGNDVARAYFEAGNYRVVDNGRTTSFSAAQVFGGDILYHGRGGNDDFANATALRTSAWGDDGDDQLRGSTGDDMLSGGTGNDVLVSSIAPRNSLTGDFNGDRRTDVAMFDDRDGTWHVGKSGGTAFVTMPWDNFETNGGWTSQLVGDFNNDGRDDIANFYPSTGAWWVSRSTGT